jgi:hypothetical protein
VRESSAICGGKKRKRRERRESGYGKLRQRRRHSREHGARLLIPRAAKHHLATSPQIS